MKTLVISDVHIGSKGCQAEAVLELLEDQSYERYILVGILLTDGYLKNIKNLIIIRLKLSAGF